MRGYCNEATFQHFTSIHAVVINSVERFKLENPCVEPGTLLNSQESIVKVYSLSWLRVDDILSPSGSYNTYLL